jgi:formylglycine-generating enzyme required for sulfatase activity
LKEEILLLVVNTITLFNLQNSFFQNQKKEAFKGFYISKYEITVEDFKVFVNETGY